MEPLGKRQFCYEKTNILLSYLYLYVNNKIPTPTTEYALTLDNGSSTGWKNRNKTITNLPVASFICQTNMTNILVQLAVPTYLKQIISLLKPQYIKVRELIYFQITADKYFLLLFTLTLVKIDQRMFSHICMSSLARSRKLISTALCNVIHGVQKKLPIGYLKMCKFRKIAEIWRKIYRRRYFFSNICSAYSYPLPTETTLLNVLNSKRYLVIALFGSSFQFLCFDV